MTDEEQDFAAAKSAFANLPWHRRRGIPEWDGYWYDSQKRLDLFFEPGKIPRASKIDLTNAGAVEVHVNCYPRISRKINSTSNRAQYELTLAEVVEQLVIHPGDLVDAITLTIEQPKGSALIRTTPSTTKGHLAASKPKPIKIDAPSSTIFSVSQTDVRIGGSGGEPATVTVRNGRVRLGLRGVDRLQIEGTCSLVAAHRSPIGTLCLEPGSALSIRPAGEDDTRALIKVGQLEAPAASSGQKASLTGIGELQAFSIEDAQVEIGRNVVLTIHHGARFSLSGDGTVRVMETIVNANFGSTAGVGMLRLDLDPWSVVQDAEGSVRLGLVRHADLNGSTAAGLGVSLIPSTTDTQADTEGLMIRNFHVPVSMAGLQTIGALSATAAVAVPLVHQGLPGQRNRQLSSRTTVNDMETHYAAALARLADSRGAPGSVATKLAWLEYRMRQSTATGRTERTVLALYRLIGYGERPGPAFLLYLALAGLLTVATLIQSGMTSFEPTWAGLERILQTFWDWLSSSLHAIRPEVGSESFEALLKRNRWASVGQVLVAIPFITGLFALRKYVKRSKAGE